MHYDTAETLLAVITAFSAKFVVGNAISFIQKQRPLLFPLLAHSRRGYVLNYGFGVKTHPPAKPVVVI